MSINFTEKQVSRKSRPLMSRAEASRLNAIKARAAKEAKRKMMKAELEVPEKDISLRSEENDERDDSSSEEEELIITHAKVPKQPKLQRNSSRRQSVQVDEVEDMNDPGPPKTDYEAESKKLREQMELMAETIVGRIELEKKKRREAKPQPIVEPEKKESKPEPKAEPKVEVAPVSSPQQPVSVPAPQNNNTSAYKEFGRKILLNI